LAQETSLISMRAVGVIPARYGSTRFSGKVLADICGKPMIQHVWERAKRASLLDELIIACDEERLFTVARNFGANCVMTAKSHPSGSDRITEVVGPIDVKVVVNIQADEPLIEPAMIDSLVEALLKDDSIYMATLIKQIEDAREINNPNIVKVVVDKNNFALYFSRAAIPYRADNAQNKPVYYKHIGLYAYTKDFLFTYKNIAPSSLENTEGLEQLRVLEEGFRIKAIKTEFDTIGVDTPKDLKRVQRILAKSKV
jgi:3-deoxy-manno-octulosonate cytidylyltransferase (CMP-KDO synthetase)